MQAFFSRESLTTGSLASWLDYTSRRFTPGFSLIAVWGPDVDVEATITRKDGLKKGLIPKKKMCFPFVLKALVPGLGKFFPKYQHNSRNCVFRDSNWC